MAVTADTDCSPKWLAVIVPAITPLVFVFILTSVIVVALAGATPTSADRASAAADATAISFLDI
jgi:hypothetical protein